MAVIGDTIEFTPGTDAETPWLFDADGSQLDGAVYDGNGRFTDGDNHATYRFQLPSDVTGGTLTLEIGNEFLVDVSTDNSDLEDGARGDRRRSTTSTTSRRARWTSTTCARAAGRCTCGSATPSPTTAGAAGSRT